jgi:replicative superfamily II helicase
MHTHDIYITWQLSNEFRTLSEELDNLRIQHEKVLRENGIYVKDLARKTLELDEILQKLDASELLPRVSESRVEALEAEKRQLQTLVDQLEAEKRQLLNTRTEQKQELDEILQKLQTEQVRNKKLSRNFL